MDSSPLLCVSTRFCEHAAGQKKILANFSTLLPPPQSAILIKVVHLLRANYSKNCSLKCLNQGCNKA